MRRLVSFVLVCWPGMLVHGARFQRYPSGKRGVGVAHVRRADLRRERQELSFALRGTNFRGVPRILLGAVDCRNPDRSENCLLR
jgi:hypothetical protein